MASPPNPDAHFTLANIPFGIASRFSPSANGITHNNSQSQPSFGLQVATRLHSQVYFLPELLSQNLLPDLDGTLTEALHKPLLNDLASLGRPAHRKLREALQHLLSKSSFLANAETLEKCSAPIASVKMHLPLRVGDFTDFSCSIDHVLNAGEAVMGKRVLPPSFKHFPVGYTGRSSSIVVSGAKIRRPLGQYKEGEEVVFGPTKALDFELEMGCVVGKGSTFGEPIRIDEAEEHIFGFVLLNDWSARDIQSLEMFPLGPLNGKSLGTTISPWIITTDALAPFKVEGTHQHQPGASYLQSKDSSAHYAVNLQVDLETPISSTGTDTDSGPDTSAKPATTTVCKSKLEWLYWSFTHMLSHQTINGCSMNSGDILATGTVSGSEPGTNGCLLEVTGGKRPLVLADGQERLYLQDRDAVRMTGWAGVLGEEGCVGFGECWGVVEEASRWE